MSRNFASCRHNWVENCKNVSGQVYRYCEKCGRIEYEQ